ncbi:response regulator [bacterium]|nr:MAG: response regulator [bacterium]
MKKKVLLVDDKEVFCKILTMNLEITDEYEVEVVTNGLLAMDAARRFNPDVILLDIIMPDISGIELAKRMKNDDQLKYIPIIFLTAVFSEEVEAQVKGFMSNVIILGKPINVKEIVACIEKVLNKP